MLLQRAFVEARNLAANQAHQQVFDLADTFEAIPQRLGCLEDQTIQEIRGLLAEYQQKYRGGSFDYLAILDMTDTEFERVFERREPF